MEKCSRAENFLYTPKVFNPNITETLISEAENKGINWVIVHNLLFKISQKWKYQFALWDAHPILADLYKLTTGL